MPYVVGCHLEDAPPEAVEAFEKVKEWAWEQDQ
nr:MAG TPA: allergen-like protein [Caudoviricetes sp.]